MDKIDIDNLINRLNNTDIEGSPRPYLGLSMIGASCHRFLQYYHYWCFTESYTNRMQRIFDTGNKAEEFMIADLQGAGIEVGKRQHSIVSFSGHWKGHTDGEAIIDEQPYLAEFKTHKNSSFNELLKKGIRLSKPGHFDQCTTYMGHLGLKACLYMAYNKDTSEYHIEIINFDQDRYNTLCEIQEEIVMTPVLIAKIGGGRATYFECKMCDARPQCHLDVLPVVTCRSCEKVCVMKDGNWMCSSIANTTSVLSIEQQKSACEYYQLGDMFK